MRRPLSRLPRPPLLSSSRFSTRAAKDPYAVLGLPQDASAEEVKRAYRRLALLYHPDVAQSEADIAKFAPLIRAYETLSDPARRYALDREREAQRARARDERRCSFRGGARASQTR